MRRNEDGTAAAASLAVEALGFLAGDTERLGRFLAISGIDPANVRLAAAEPGFLAGVLDYLCADEALLTTFAANAGVDPVRVANARLALAGPPPADA